MKEFLPRYEQDKKNFNLRINDRVKQGDFKQAIKDLDAKISNQVSGWKSF